MDLRIIFTTYTHRKEKTTMSRAWRQKKGYEIWRGKSCDEDDNENLFVDKNLFYFGFWSSYVFTLA